MVKKAFGELAVEKGLISRVQLYECLAEQERLRASGRRKLLSAIMHDRDLLSLDQVNELLTELEGSRRKEQIEGYQIVSKLGRGGMGAVYLARQTKLGNRLVAIKVLPPRLANNKDYLKRFQREAAATAELDHPNIVRALDFGESNGYHYFVMEYVDGDTLKSVIQTHGVIEEHGAVELAIRVASAIEHAWQAKIVHRDIKPANIMIDRNGTVKLCDLGLAIHTEDEDLSVTRAGVIMGTPYYMSPEQGSMQELDVRSDIYSLGATLYHMVTGRVPFDGDNVAEVVTKHLCERLPDPRELNPKLTPWLCRILSKMMAKERGARYVDATELIVDLEQLQHYLTVGDAAEEAPVARPPLTIRRRRFGALTLLLLVLIGVLLFDRAFPGVMEAQVPTELRDLRDRFVASLSQAEGEGEDEDATQGATEGEAAADPEPPPSPPPPQPAPQPAPRPATQPSQPPAKPAPAPRPPPAPRPRASPTARPKPSAETTGLARIEEAIALVNGTNGANGSEATPSLGGQPRAASAPTPSGKAGRLREVFARARALASEGELDRACALVDRHLRTDPNRRDLWALRHDLIAARQLEQKVASKLTARLGGEARGGKVELDLGGGTKVNLSPCRLPPDELIRLAALDPDHPRTSRLFGVLFALYDRPRESREHLLKAQAGGQDVGAYLQLVSE